MIVTLIPSKRAEYFLIKVIYSYKCDKNEVPTASANGSTVPLVDIRKLDPEVGEYDPFQHRKVAHPTS